VQRLRSQGIAGVFTPGTTLETIVAWVHAHVKPKG